MAIPPPSTSADLAAWSAAHAAWWSVFATAFAAFSALFAGLITYYIGRKQLEVAVAQTKQAQEHLFRARINSQRIFIDSVGIEASRIKMSADQVASLLHRQSMGVSSSISASVCQNLVDVIKMSPWLPVTSDIWLDFPEIGMEFSQTMARVDQINALLRVKGPMNELRYGEVEELLVNLTKNCNALQACVALEIDKLSKSMSG